MLLTSVALADWKSGVEKASIFPLAAHPHPPYKHRQQPFFERFGGFPMRPSRRGPGELRPVTLERGVVEFVEGSGLVRFGGTHGLVAATLEGRPPPRPQ